MSEFPAPALAHSLLVPHSLAGQAAARDASRFYGEGPGPDRPGVIVLLPPCPERDLLWAAAGERGRRLDDLSMAAPAMLGLMDPLGVIQGGLAGGAPLFLSPELLSAFRIALRPADRERLADFLDAQRIVTRADLESEGAVEQLAAELQPAPVRMGLPPPDREFSLEDIADLIGSERPVLPGQPLPAEQSSLTFRSIRNVMDRGTLGLRLECEEGSALLGLTDNDGNALSVTVPGGSLTLLVGLPLRGSLPVVVHLLQSRERPFRVVGLNWHAAELVLEMMAECRLSSRVAVSIPN